MRKRWLLGAISGFFFGLSLSLILVGLHVVHLDSKLLTLLPVIGLVLGIVGALTAPRGRAPKPVPVTAPSDVSEFTGTPPGAPVPPTEAMSAPPPEPPTHANSSETPAPEQPEGDNS